MRSLAAILMLLLNAGFLGSAQAAQVELQAECFVTGDLIHLGDIARIEEPRPDLFQKLQTLVLAPSPAAEKTVWLRFADIQSRVAAQGLNLATIEFRGSSVVKVQRKLLEAVADPVASFAPEVWIRSQVQAFLKAKAPHLGQMEILLQVSPQSMAVARLQPLTLVTITGWKHPLEGPQQLTLNLWNARNEPVQLVVDCSLKQVPWIPVPKHPLPAGHPIQSSDLVFVQLESSGPVLTQWQDIVGKVTRRAIESQQPLVENDLRTVPLIRPNENVVVAVRGNGFSIRREMKSRSSAALGEQVVLMDPETRETLTARVTGVRTAEVGVGSAVSAPSNFQFVAPTAYQTEPGSAQEGHSE